MARQKLEGTTRQIYASIPEDLYIAAKARATELRIPLRQFVERALNAVLKEGGEQSPVSSAPPSIWDDEYLRMQTHQPLGSPLELTPEEAERVVRASFGQEPGRDASNG